ncbi:Alpha/Beta hydrolase protein [Fomes fomentarius]|nr:Alpha/Beta hydrolase protein [Fomes fomentarius]
MKLTSSDIISLTLKPEVQARTIFCSLGQSGYVDLRMDMWTTTDMWQERICLRCHSNWLSRGSWSIHATQQCNRDARTISSAIYDGPTGYKLSTSSSHDIVRLLFELRSRACDASICTRCAPAGLPAERSAFPSGHLRELYHHRSCYDSRLFCRIGPFGFPQGSEADQKGALNLGLKDQLAGLRWVQSHISAFGGDPTKIFESGFAIMLHAVEASRHQVVWDTFVSTITACANTSEGDTFLCVQSVETGSLLTAWQQTVGSFLQSFLFVPVLDGPNGNIPDLPLKLLATGKCSKIIAGTNLDEGTTSIPTTISTEQEVVQSIAMQNVPFADPPPSSKKMSRL